MASLTALEWILWHLPRCLPEWNFMCAVLGKGPSEEQCPQWGLLETTAQRQHRIAYVNEITSTDTWEERYSFLGTLGEQSYIRMDNICVAERSQLTGEGMLIPKRAKLVYFLIRFSNIMFISDAETQRKKEFSQWLVHSPKICSSLARLNSRTLNSVQFPTQGAPTTWISTRSKKLQCRPTWDFNSSTLTLNVGILRVPDIMPNVQSERGLACSVVASGGTLSLALTDGCFCVLMSSLLTKKKMISLMQISILKV